MRILILGTAVIFLSLNYFSISLAQIEIDLGLETLPETVPPQAVSLIEKLVKLVKQLWIYLLGTAKEVIGWLSDTFGINLTKVIYLVRNILVRFLEIIISAIRWVIDLVL